MTRTTKLNLRESRTLNQAKQPETAEDKVAKVISAFNATRTVTSILAHEVEVNDKKVIITRINRLERNGVEITKLTPLESKVFAKNMLLDLMNMIKKELSGPVEVCLSPRFWNE